MHIGKRLNASLNCTFCTVGCFGLRKHHRCLHGREQVLTSVLCFPSQQRDLLLASFLLSNIPRDLRCSNNLAFRISDGRNGQRNDDEASVLASPNSLVVIDTLPASYARYYLMLLALPICRNHNCNGLTNHFFRSVAKYSLGPSVPVYDNSIEGLAYDRLSSSRVTISCPV